MNKVINIPNADRDERIGSVFNHLFSVIFANEQIRNNDVPVWDFQKPHFPSIFLFPFAIYKSKCKNVQCKNVVGYMKTI